MADLYFILDAPRGAVKIGRANKPERRLRELQTGCANRLELLLVFRGEGEREKEFHERFAEWRLEGEWFRYRGVRSYLKAYRSEQRTPITRNDPLPPPPIQSYQTALGILHSEGVLPTWAADLLRGESHTRIGRAVLRAAARCDAGRLAKTDPDLGRVRKHLAAL